MNNGVLFLMLILLAGVMFMSFRTQKKQRDQHAQLQQSINVGDVVVMLSGISGTVVDTSDTETIDVEIAEDVITTWQRGSVQKKLSPESETPDGAHDDLTDEDTADGESGGDRTTAPESASATATSTATSTATAEGGTEPTDATGIAAERRHEPFAGSAESGRNGSEPSGETSGPRTSS